MSLLKGYLKILKYYKHILIITVVINILHRCLSANICSHLNLFACIILSPQKGWLGVFLQWAWIQFPSSPKFPRDVQFIQPKHLTFTSFSFRTTKLFTNYTRQLWRRLEINRIFSSINGMIRVIIILIIKMQIQQWWDKCTLLSIAGVANIHYIYFRIKFFVAFIILSINYLLNWYIWFVNRKVHWIKWHYIRLAISKCISSIKS